MYKARWQVELFFQWIKAASAHQEVLRHLVERGEDANLDRGVGLRAHREH